MEPDAKLTEAMLELALQRTLVGFEQGLKRIMDVLGLRAWACLFPPSFQSGGRPLFLAHGIHPKGPLLTKASQDGLESLGFSTEQGQANLVAFARELAPEPQVTFRVLRLSRDRQADMLMFCYKLGSGAVFGPTDVSRLEQVGRHLDRCFLLLAEAQEHEFMAGLFRVVSNLHSEGLCILDNQYRLVFENRNFREHMLRWQFGEEALNNLTLPKQTSLPAVWKDACEGSLQAFRQVALPQAGNRMMVSQGPQRSLVQPLSDHEYIEGAVRYLAFHSSLGVRPYLLLTSGVKQSVDVSAQALDRLVNDFAFSRRESQLADLILKGRSAQEISRQLSIALPTVKSHIRNILRKAGVRNRLQLMGLCYK